MATIGDELRRERHRRGISLSDVENHLHIRAAYLEALETEQYGIIPGSVYAKGFLRNYGNFLGLDGDRLVDQYKTMLGEPMGVPKRRIKPAKIEQHKDSEEQETLEKPKRRLTYQGRRERRQATMARERIIATVIVICILIFLVWLFVL